MRNNKLLIILTILGLWSLVAGCGGGGTTLGVINTGDTATPAVTTGTITGILTTDGIETHGTSATGGDPVTDAEVWCEDGTGTRCGEDTTGSDGSFTIDGLPAGEQLEFHFRFMAEGGFEDIEGEMAVELAPGEQKHFEHHIRQHDDDGDGVCERVGNGGENHNLQIQLRERREQSGLPDLPEELTDEIQDWASLPLIPYEDETAEEDDRDTSAIDGVPFSVLGLEYLRERNCTELEDALYVGDTATRFSWALYEIAGFVDQDIESLTVSCTPDEGSEYYIGVSNFRSRHWEWSGPVTEAEYTFAVNTGFRHVSRNGSLYFLIITAGESAATMAGAFATPIEVAQPDPPVCPEGLTRVTGTVLDADGNPLPRTHMDVSDGTRVKFGRVHWDGSFGFAMPDGTFTFTPVLRGYTFAPESVEITLPSEDEFDLAFIGTEIVEE